MMIGIISVFRSASFFLVVQLRNCADARSKTGVCYNLGRGYGFGIADVMRYERCLNFNNGCRASLLVSGRLCVVFSHVVLV